MSEREEATNDAVAMTGIAKTFGGVVALEHVEAGGLVRRAYDSIVLWWRTRGG